MKQFEVIDNDGIFEGHPQGLVRTESDRLVCFFLERTHHGASNYFRGMYTTSDDRGRTWSQKRPITKASYPAEGTTRRQTAHPELLDDGRIVAVNHEIQSADSGPERRSVDTTLWISDDEAESWQGPRETSIEGQSGYLAELSDDRWVVATVKLYDDAHEYRRSVQTYVSDDEGETWSGPNVIATDHDHPLNDELGEGVGRDYVGRSEETTSTFSETSLLELPDGELVAFVRDDSNQGLDMFKAVSRDGGETWGELSTLPIPGPHKPMPGMLNSGRVMLTYRFVQGGDGPFWGAQNTFAAMTDVESCLSSERSEAQANILPLDHDTAVDSDSGYTDWVQFDDGEIYVVNYTVDDAPPERTKEPPGYDGDYAVYPRAHIRGYSFYEDEFMARPIPEAVAEHNPGGEKEIRKWARRTGYDIADE